MGELCGTRPEDAGIQLILALGIVCCEPLSIVAATMRTVHTWLLLQVAALHSKILSVCQEACDAKADYSVFPPDWLFHHRWGHALVSLFRVPFRAFYFLLVAVIVLCVHNSAQPRVRHREVEYDMLVRPRSAYFH